MWPNSAWHWALRTTCVGAASVGLGAAAWLYSKASQRREAQELSSSPTSYCSGLDPPALDVPPLSLEGGCQESQLAAALGEALSSLAPAVNEPAKHPVHGEEECSASPKHKGSDALPPDQASESGPPAADGQQSSPAELTRAEAPEKGVSTPAALVEYGPTASVGAKHSADSSGSSTSSLATAKPVVTGTMTTASSSTGSSSSSGPAGVSPPPHDHPAPVQSTGSNLVQVVTSTVEGKSPTAAASTGSPTGPTTPWQNTRLHSTGLLPPLRGLRRRVSDNSGVVSSSNVSSPIKRPNINTARSVPSRDVVASNAQVVPSLQVQYPDLSNSSSSGRKTAPSLSARCALLCERNCVRLRDISGEFGETTALDIGCSTGGSSFELALSFSHVLGLDSDPMLVLAAKELKESGVLEYRLTPGQPSCYARVNPDVDRDRVRFWQYGLPELPPKLHVVDAVLVEAVEVRKQPWLRRLLEQVPKLLKSKGTCVVVLPWDGKLEGTGHAPTTSSSEGCKGEGGVGVESSSSMGQASGGQGGAGLQPAVGAGEVRELLGSFGMRFVAEERFDYPVQGGAGLGFAHAMVWRHN